MSVQTEDKGAKRAFWAVAAFYLLIAFEFIYMASPFAVYFYSVYRPSLNFINQIPGAAWLTSFFLPHIVIETSSFLVNAHNVIGGILAAVGFLAFCIGAAQVYYHKLARKGAVTGGVYNFIRHPQYAAFALSSFGMLLLWPRFIALILFVTVLFAYYFLAKIEEKECEEQFGQSYLDYKNETHMFLPFKIPFVDQLPELPASRLGKILTVGAAYVVTLLLAIGLALGLQSLALDSLYAIYTEDAATISVAQVETEKLARILDVATAHEAVQTQLAAVPDDAKYINYVLPTAWYVSEIPMAEVPGARGHDFSSDYDEDLYKIIFVQVDLPAESDVEGKGIVLNAIGRTPVTEVWVDLSRDEVTEIKTPLVMANYEDVPVPVY